MLTRRQQRMFEKRQADALQALGARDVAWLPSEVASLVLEACVLILAKPRNDQAPFSTQAGPRVRVYQLVTGGFRGAGFQRCLLSEKQQDEGSRGRGNNPAVAGSLREVP